MNGYRLDLVVKFLEVHIKPPTAGTIEIKCPRCKKVQHIHLIEPDTQKTTTEKTT